MSGVTTLLSPCQFGCCGFYNASDWINLNPGAVMGNGGIPPECGENCTVGMEDGCTNYSFMNATVNINFNVVAMVRAAHTLSSSALDDHINFSRAVVTSVLKDTLSLHIPLEVWG